MIPMWIKILWNCWLFATWLSSLFSISGFIVMGLTKTHGDKFSLENEVIKCGLVTVSMAAIAIAVYILVSLLYDIPVDQWLG